MAARERVVFLLRCALLAALLASLWGFYSTYLGPSARAEDDGPKPAVFGTGIRWQFVPHVPDAGRARAVVLRFLRARERGDARTACRLLSTSQRAVTAWVVAGRRQPATDASCERHILRSNELTAPTNPPLIAELREGFYVERYERALIARPYGRDRWGLQLFEQGGRIRIEAEASARLDWLAVSCDRTYAHPRRACGCIYDEARLIGLRRRGPRYGVSLDARTQREARRTCT